MARIEGRLTKGVCWLVSGLALLASGCSDEAETSGGGSGGAAGDGKIYPPTNGVHISEAEACQQLKAAQDQRRSAIEGCILTTRSCPDLLVVQFSVACMEYDQGSVQGCVDHYAQAADCDALKAAINDCVVTPYEGSEPAGCP